jgi:hypothetical protein
MWAATCGRIDVDDDGVAIYTAPAEPVTCTVTATSVADPSASAVAVVTIADPTVWLRQYGTVGGYVMPGGIAVDPAGYLLVAGYANGELGGRAFGASDGFVIQFDTDGTERWRRWFGSDHADWTADVTVGPGGDVFVAGYAAGDLRGTGSGSAFLVRFDRDGNEAWRRQFGAARRADEVAYGLGVVADADGNAYVTWVAEAVVSDPVDLALVSKFDAGGAEVWRRPFAEGFPYAAMAVDAEGRVLVAAPTDGGVAIVTFDPAGEEVGRRAISTDDVVANLRILSDGRVYLTGTAPPVVGDAFDAYVAAFASDGAPIWRRQLGTINADYGRAVAVADDGRVYLTGTAPPVAGDAFDAYVAAFASDGAPIWRRQLGTINADYGRAVAVADDGRVLMTGASEIQDAFDEERIDVFLVLLDADGEERWRRRYGGDDGGRDWASDAVFGVDGHPVVIGGAHGTLRPLNANPALVIPPFDERVDTELFVMKLTP